MGFLVCILYVSTFLAGFANFAVCWGKLWVLSKQVTSNLTGSTSRHSPASNAPTIMPSTVESHIKQSSVPPLDHFLHASHTVLLGCTLSLGNALPPHVINTKNPPPPQVVVLGFDCVKSSQPTSPYDFEGSLAPLLTNSRERSEL